MSNSLEKQLTLFGIDDEYFKELIGKLYFIASRAGEPLIPIERPNDYTSVPFEYYDEETNLGIFALYDYEGIETVRIGKIHPNGTVYDSEIFDAFILPDYSFGKKPQEVQLNSYRPGLWEKRFERLYEELCQKEDSIPISP